MTNFQTIEIDLYFYDLGIMIGGQVTAEIETTSCAGSDWAPSSSSDELETIGGELEFTVLESGREGAIEFDQLPEFISELVWEQAEEQIDPSEFQLV